MLASYWLLMRFVCFVWAAPHRPSRSPKSLFFDDSTIVFFLFVLFVICRAQNILKIKMIQGLKLTFYKLRLTFYKRTLTFYKPQGPLKLTFYKCEANFL